MLVVQDLTAGFIVYIPAGFVEHHAPTRGHTPVVPAREGQGREAAVAEHVVVEAEEEVWHLPLPDGADPGAQGGPGAAEPRGALEAGHGGFEGALLLVDIDHFKHVNDVQGHAAGDQVLVEVAQRLNDAVRSGDLVVRWGGEEFLILAPRAANEQAEQAEQVAARVLRVLGQTPITVGVGAAAQALHITASIGYARFPLPPYDAEVPWEQAVNLADMALYTAKNQGRNRAVGIVSSTAATRAALQDVEADFDRARHEGRVTLLQTQGPEPRDNVRAA